MRCDSAWQCVRLVLSREKELAGCQGQSQFQGRDVFAAVLSASQFVGKQFVMQRRIKKSLPVCEMRSSLAGMAGSPSRHLLDATGHVVACIGTGRRGLTGLKFN